MRYSAILCCLASGIRPAQPLQKPCMLIPAPLTAARICSVARVATLAVPEGLCYKPLIRSLRSFVLLANCMVLAA